jgi:hypothetical protein
MIRIIGITVVVVAAGFLFIAALGADTASAHRSGCHRWHTCPSDHATYRWRGWLCVAPYADERNATFRRRITYLGRTYWCRR